MNPIDKALDLLRSSNMDDVVQGALLLESLGLGALQTARTKICNGVGARAVDIVRARLEGRRGLRLDDVEDPPYPCDRDPALALLTRLFPDVEALDLSSNTRFSRLDNLHGLDHLRILDLSGCTSVQTDEYENEVEGGDVYGVQSVRDLAELAALVTLNLRGCTHLDHTSIAFLKQVEHLDLTDTRPASAADVAPLTRLRTLRADLTREGSLEPLRALTALEELHLGGIASVLSLAPLADLPVLRVLSFTSPVDRRYTHLEGYPLREFLDGITAQNAQILGLPIPPEHARALVQFHTAVGTGDADAASAALDVLGAAPDPAVLGTIVHLRPESLRRSSIRARLVRLGIDHCGETSLDLDDDLSAGALGAFAGCAAEHIVVTKTRTELHAYLRFPSLRSLTLGTHTDGYRPASERDYRLLSGIPTLEALDLTQATDVPRAWRRRLEGTDLANFFAFYDDEAVRNFLGLPPTDEAPAPETSPGEADPASPWAPETDATFEDFGRGGGDFPF